MTSVIEGEDGEAGVQDPAENEDESTGKPRQPSSGSLKDHQLADDGRFSRSNKVIGHGSTKIVYHARDEEEGCDVAWNEVIRGTKEEDEWVIAKFKNEIKFLESLEHPNIITLLFKDVSSKRALFITEMLPGGTLKQFVATSKKKKLQVKVIKKICKQLLFALNYLHTRDPPVVHSDLKCDNIFIDSHNCEVKVGDFGLSGHCGDQLLTGIHQHRLEFVPPEAMGEGASYSCKGDVYSFGMCVLEMISGEYPYSECDDGEAIKAKAQAGILPEAFDAIVVDEYRTHKTNVKEFISYCLSPIVKRPNCDELLKDNFVIVDEKEKKSSASSTPASSVAGDVQHHSVITMEMLTEPQAGPTGRIVEEGLGPSGPNPERTVSETSGTSSHNPELQPANMTSYKLHGAWNSVEPASEAIRRRRSSMMSNNMSSITSASFNADDHHDENLGPDGMELANGFCPTDLTSDTQSKIEPPGAPAATFLSPDNLSLLTSSEESHALFPSHPGSEAGSSELAVLPPSLTAMSPVPAHVNSNTSLCSEESNSPMQPPAGLDDLVALYYDSVHAAELQSLMTEQRHLRERMRQLEAEHKEKTKQRNLKKAKLADELRRLGVDPPQPRSKAMAARPASVPADHIGNQAQTDRAGIQHQGSPNTTESKPPFPRAKVDAPSAVSPPRHPDATPPPTPGATAASQGRANAAGQSDDSRLPPRPMAAAPAPALRPYIKTDAITTTITTGLPADSQRPHMVATITTLTSAKNCEVRRTSAVTYSPSPPTSPGIPKYTNPPSCAASHVAGMNHRAMASPSPASPEYNLATTKNIQSFCESQIR